MIELTNKEAITVLTALQDRLLWDDVDPTDKRRIRRFNNIVDVYKMLQGRLQIQFKVQVEKIVTEEVR